jgi:hypothetical protein
MGFVVVVVVVVVKNVVLKFRPFLTHKKHLVFVAAGIKLKDLQVMESNHFSLFLYLKEN